MAHEKNHDYHILNPSLWPFLSALGAFILLFGSVLFMHGGSVFNSSIRSSSGFILYVRLVVRCSF